MKILYNKEGTAWVSANKIREITIAELHQFNGTFWSVKGWYSKEEYFTFGEFMTPEAAKRCLDELGEEMSERKRGGRRV